MKRTVISVRGVSKSYKIIIERKEVIRKVLDNIFFDVKEGEILGVLGPNGAGKTTLFKIISGVLKPDKGDVLVYGHSVVKEPEIVKKYVTMIGGQGGIGLFFHLNVIDNLRFFAKLYDISPNVAKIRIKEALEVLGLEKYSKLPVLYLSSGLRQRTLLAKALIVRSPILIFDEPTLGLDPIIANQIREFIRNYLSSEEKITILFSSHYPEEIELLCDRVIILHNGKVIFSEYIQNIVAKTNTINVTIELAKENNISWSTLLVSIKERGVENIIVNSNKSITIIIKYRVFDKVIKEIVNTIEKTFKLKIRSIKVNKPSLRDIYLKLLESDKNDKNY